MSLQEEELGFDPILLFVEVTGSGPPMGPRIKEWWVLPEPGSGGYIPADRSARELTGTGGKLALVDARRTHRADENVAGLLRLVRTTLSLNVTELSAAVCVERPTVYAWLAGKSQPQSANRQRLEELAQYARHWRRIGSRPLGRLVRGRQDGASIAELLQHERVPQAQVMEQLQRLAAGAGEQRRVRPAREVAEELGVAELHEEQIDVATGKRFGPA